MAFRLKRLADELRMRRKRLDAFAYAPEWPGKAPALAREQAQYDGCLLLATRMLELPVPDQEPTPGRPLPPEVRAVLEDRLAHAGLDVFAPRSEMQEDALGEGGLIL